MSESTGDAPTCFTLATATHPLILYDANVEGELERTEAFSAELWSSAIEVGGTITGEHGVGIEKSIRCVRNSRMGERGCFRGQACV